MALHVDTQAQIDTGHIPLLIFAEMEFDSGTLRLHSGAQGSEITWNSSTWLGAGGLGKISPVLENSELEVYDLQMSLTGIDPTLIATALSEDYFGRPARIWLAVLDDQYTIQGDPIGPFAGLMDTMDGELGEVGTITMTIKNRLADWQRPKIRRYTNEDQQAEYPGDLGMEFVAQMVEKELVW